MGTFHAMLVGGGLLAVAAVIMASRRLAILALFAVSLLLALATSAGSALHATQRHAGTGHLISRGFPKPFHFHRLETDRRDINFVFYGANTLVHFGVISLLAAVLTPRPRNDMARMAGGMLIVRLVLGVIFLILAVIGGFVPIMQGWIFFLLAILVLFPRARFTEKILLKAEPKVPRVVAFMRRMGIGSAER